MVIVIKTCHFNFLFIDVFTQKIRILDEENDGTASETGSTCSGGKKKKDFDKLCVVPLNSNSLELSNE